MDKSKCGSDGQDVSSQFNELIEKSTGLTMDEIKSFDFEEIHQQIEKKKGITLKLRDSKLLQPMYTGSMLLSFGKIISDIDAKFDKVFNCKS